MSDIFNFRELDDLTGSLYEGIVTFQCVAWYFDIPNFFIVTQRQKNVSQISKKFEKQGGRKSRILVG